MSYNLNFCVYGASSDAIDPEFLSCGERLGEELARRGYGLVFGGGSSGMMGAAARGAHRAGGKIIGVAPSFFDVDGILFEHCTEFLYPDTMRERKKTLEELSDGFIVTPGGIGTFDEFFEILSLRQLGRHSKPIAVYNINGYFDSMCEMLDRAVDMKFMACRNRQLYLVTDSIDEIFNYFDSFKAEEFDIRRLRSIDDK